MTTFRQTDYEEMTGGRKKKTNKAASTNLKTSKTMANPQDMLTVRELECVTAVFRSRLSFKL